MNIGSNSGFDWYRDQYVTTGNSLQITVCSFTHSCATDKVMLMRSLFPLFQDNRGPTFPLKKIRIKSVIIDQ